MTEPVTTIVDAEIDGERVDVRVSRGRIEAVGAALDRSGTAVVDAAGGALIPGLHDHHLHLLAMAAAGRSVDVSGRAQASAAAFEQSVLAADGRLPPGEWMRVVGYEDAHGPLDRHRLDGLAPGRPLRVQHRSGAMWVVSSAGLADLGVGHDPPAGVERDAAGSPTGRLHRLDQLMADRLPPAAAPDLADVGARLVALGVTGVTDATPYDAPGSFEVLAAACRSGELPQHVVVTGGPALAAEPTPAGLDRGPVKVVVADNALPTIEELLAAFAPARTVGRPVAVHCVSRIGLVLALAAWEEVGAGVGDRIEHGSVIPVELVARIAELGLTVVTQPGFIADRGDRYLAEVDADDRPHLYRCGSLLDAGIQVGGSTDAPFGPEDPWLAMRTAIDRRTATGAVVGEDEALSARQALGLFLGAPDDPGGPERAVAAGASADLVLLAEPLADALGHLSATLVRRTWIAGHRSSE